jgi:uncharacterized protein
VDSFGAKLERRVIFCNFSPDVQIFNKLLPHYGTWHMAHRTIDLKPNKQNLLERVKSRIQHIEPDAELFLFGSYARGNATEDSDLDILVLLDGEIVPERKYAIWEIVSTIELDLSVGIDISIQNRLLWRTDPRLQVTPFYRSVSADAVAM